MNIIPIGVGIAIGYRLHKDSLTIRAYKKRVKELEKESTELRIGQIKNRIDALEYEKLQDQLSGEWRERPPWLPNITC